jgi:hypothetical protein
MIDIMHETRENERKDGHFRLEKDFCVRNAEQVIAAVHHCIRSELPVKPWSKLWKGLALLL